MTREGFLPAGTPLRDYLALPAMNSSGLREFRRSPAHYRHAVQNPGEETDAQHFGTAVHVAVLEPERFGSSYAVLEGCMGRYKSGAKKGQRCAKPASIARSGKGWCGIHDPKKGTPATTPALKLDDYTRVRAIEQALATHPIANALLRRHPGTVEVSGVFRDDETDVVCKIRPDRVVTLPDGQVLAIDLKTSRKPTDGGWWRELAKLGYHYQAALVRRGLAKLGTVCTASVIVAVESAAPFGVGCYRIDEDDIARAHEDITGWLHEYAKCLESGVWPSYPAGLHEGTRLPDWAFEGE